MAVRKGYYVYEMDIYPCRLFVITDGWARAKAGDISKTFRKMNGIPVEGSELFPSDDDVLAMTMTNVVRRKDDKSGTMVVFRSPKHMTGENMCHESFHVMDEIMMEFGLERMTSGGNEHLAYLIDCIYSYIEMARKGIGTCVEFDNEQ